MDRQGIEHPLGSVDPFMILDNIVAPLSARPPFCVHPHSNVCVSTVLLSLDDLDLASLGLGAPGRCRSIFTGDGDAKEKATTAGDLLKQYGGAYLLTTTSFAIVSFAICYTLVSNGVDVAGLLGKIGIEPSQNAQTGGTFAIAYAAHKAASPIRFPPTVALTPVVAKMLGKDSGDEAEAEEDA